MIKTHSKRICNDPWGHDDYPGFNKHHQHSKCECTQGFRAAAKRDAQREIRVNYDI